MAQKIHGMPAPPCLQVACADTPAERHDARRRVCGDHSGRFHRPQRRHVVVYGLLRADMVGLYLWAWASDPALRVLAGRRAAALGLGLAVWVGSLAFAEPTRYAMWALAIACGAPRRRARLPSQRGHPDRSARRRAAHRDRPRMTAATQRRVPER